MNFAERFIRFLCGLALLALVACAPTPQREGAGEFIDDTIITGKVKAALVADPDLKATQINVETFKGTVQLSGFVPAEHIGRAVSLVRRIDGVKDVKNDMVPKR
ncbi:BON domain-containing protein [Massilia genomosp. 1]|uniref:BON domain-containing protein n=1 Tax=Massilia genomosp. 1 TaxID=2609280 RepID=A0ABX0MRR8_9BURK|nr:BON domain-containing protein [Massilia genomosp. 1]NHZ62044.1 BON domain-containing protein [Massilia genomosp. 1]